MVRELKSKGFDVVIVDNLSQGHEESVKDFRLEKIDLVTQPDKLHALFKSENFDGVVHMAGFIQVGESYTDPAKYYENNVFGFMNLLGIMKDVKANNIILSSSAAVYGNPVKVPVEEGDPKNPVNPYGETKYIMERMLEDYETAYGIKFISIRYFNASGASLDGSIGEAHPLESHLIPNALKAAIDGDEFTLFGSDYNTPDGTCIRDYIHVLDLTETHSLAMQSLLNGGKSNFYNAGIGHGYSNKEVIDAIEKITGLAVKTKVADRRAGDPDQLYASADKIREDLNWKPKYDLEQIVDSAYKWHKNHPKGYGGKI